MFMMLNFRIYSRENLLTVYKIYGKRPQKNINNSFGKLVIWYFYLIISIVMRPQNSLLLLRIPESLTWFRVVVGTGEGERISAVTLLHTATWPGKPAARIIREVIWNRHWWKTANLETATWLMAISSVINDFVRY